MVHNIDFIDDIIDQASAELIDNMPDAVNKSSLYPPRDANVSIISTDEALRNYLDALDDFRSACFRLYESAELDQLVDDIADDYRGYDPDVAFDGVSAEYGDDAAYEVVARIITEM